MLSTVGQEVLASLVETPKHALKIQIHENSNRGIVVGVARDALVGTETVKPNLKSKDLRNKKGELENEEAEQLGTWQVLLNNGEFKFLWPSWKYLVMSATKVSRPNENPMLE